MDSAYCVSALVTKKLIRECGRLNVPGRPIVYETTPDFLRVFGLSSIDELPTVTVKSDSGEDISLAPAHEEPDAAADTTEN